MTQKEMAVYPESPLAKLLARLQRPERRMLLAAVQCAPGPRQKRLERELKSRLARLGIS